MSPEEIDLLVAGLFALACLLVVMTHSDDQRL